MPTIAEIDAAIDALVTTQQVDYKIGDKTVKAGDKIKQLMALRKQLIEYPDSEVSLVAFDLNVDEFGVDNSEFET